MDAPAPPHVRMTLLSRGLPRNSVLLMAKILHHFRWKGVYPRAPILTLGCALLSLGWEVPMAKILHHHACCPTLNWGERGVSATVAARPTHIEVVQDFVHQPSRLLLFCMWASLERKPAKRHTCNVKCASCSASVCCARAPRLRASASRRLTLIQHLFDVWPTTPCCRR